MTIPIVCETENCARFGTEINRISGIETQDFDSFYESWRGGDKADYCPVCYQLGILQDPEPERELYVGQMGRLTIS